jgi:hypothetical protein
MIMRISSLINADEVEVTRRHAMSISRIVHREDAGTDHTPPTCPPDGGHQAQDHSSNPTRYASNASCKLRKTGYTSPTANSYDAPTGNAPLGKNANVEQNVGGKNEVCFTTYIPHTHGTPSQPVPLNLAPPLHKYGTRSASKVTSQIQLDDQTLAVIEEARYWSNRRRDGSWTRKSISTPYPPPSHVDVQMTPGGGLPQHRSS